MIMNNNTRTKKSFRFSSLLALVLFLNQFVFISFASAMSNISIFNSAEEGGYQYTNELQNAIDIENYLNSHSEYEQVDTTKLQYKKADYVDESALTGYSTLSEFKESIKGTPAGGDPLHIPINVGDITIFITKHPMLEHKMVGDEFINTRIVRSQIEAKLGRNVINSPEQPRYNSEKEQYNALLNNTKAMAASLHTLRYGEPYLNYGFGTPSMDMIWPELRIINGESVIVPIVYLTSATVNEYKVKGNTVNFYEGALVKTANVNGVDISLGRGAFLQAMSDITFKNSSVNSTGSMKLIAGGTLSLLSSQVNGKGNVSIAGKTIHAETLVHRYDFGNETGGRYGEITGISSESGNVTLRSYGDMNFYGVQVNAGKGITIAADGSIKIGLVPLKSSYSGNKNGWSVKRSAVEYLTSKLSATDTIKILASGKIEISGAEIVSDKGHIELLAGLGISIVDDLQTTQMQRKGKFGKKKINESVYQTVAIRSVLDAGKGIKLDTVYGDINLKSVDIKSIDGASAKAQNGAINLLMTSETDHYSYSSVKKDMFSTVTKQKGHNKVTGIPNTIVGGLSVEALNGVTVEFVGNPNLSISDQLDEISNFEGLSYLKTLKDRSDVDFNAVANINDNWSKKQKSLSPAMVAVITIAVAVAAGPAAAGVASTAGGASVAAVIGSTTAASALGAASAAAFTSLVTTAAVSLASGNSIDSTLASLSSDENLRSLAITMVTAGAISAVDSTFFSLDKDMVEATVAGGSTQSALDTAQSIQGLSDQTLQVIAHSTVRAGINTLVAGGDINQFGTEFTRSLTQSAIAKLGKHMANKIGDAWDINNADAFDTAMKYVLHAGAGCVIGTATAINYSNQSGKDGCSYGALGGVTGELVGSLYKDHTKEKVEKAQGAIKELVEENKKFITDLQAEGKSNQEIVTLLKQKGVNFATYQGQINDLRKAGVDLARFSAGLTAMLAGAQAAGVNVSADTGANAAENNALFLLAIPFIIKAIDIAFTLDELYTEYKKVNEAYDESKGGSKDKGDEALAEFVASYAGEAAFGKIIEKLIPGATIVNKAGEYMEKSVILGKIKAMSQGGLDRLMSAVRTSNPRDPSLSRAFDDKIEKAKADGELPSSVPASRFQSLSRVEKGEFRDKTFAEAEAVKAKLLAENTSLTPVRKAAAYSRAKVTIDGEIIETEGYTNIRLGGGGTKVKIKNTPGVTGGPDDFRITDVEAYMSELKTKYKEIPPVNAMHPAIEARIRDRIGQPGENVFPNLNGGPGYHAEVQVINEIYSKHPDIDPGSVSVSTMLLQPNVDVQDFTACSNCKSILGGFDIITDKLKD
jgi:filamentous hemagglutinin